MLNQVQILYKPVKHITLRVQPTLEVSITVPLNTTQHAIDEILHKRQEWINKTLAYFKRFQLSASKELVSGENIEYLGKNYRLKVLESNEPSVKLVDNYIQVNVLNKNNLAQKKKLIDEWYKSQSANYFNQVIQKYITVINKDIVKVSIRKMKTRWGSCNTKKAYINLNLELIKKHPLAIEYVVFHELVHLLHYNHNKYFYNFLATHMPDWRIRRARLYYKSLTIFPSIKQQKRSIV
jgi:predicted metal-dependent hydrolase